MPATARSSKSPPIDEHDGPRTGVRGGFKPEAPDHPQEEEAENQDCSRRTLQAANGLGPVAIDATLNTVSLKQTCHAQMPFAGL